VAHAFILATQETDQEHHSSKPARQIVYETLFQKNLSQKRAGGVAEGVGPEFKPQYHTHTKKKFYGWVHCDIYICTYNN
jgi:hypothetical protein